MSRSLPPETVRIAAAQYPVEPVATLRAWREKTTRWVEQAAAAEADLAVFPEYGLIELAHAAGRECAGDLRRTLEAVADRYEEAEHHFASLARASALHILAPSGPRRRPDGRFVNTASLVAPRAGIGRQEKAILTPFEHGWGLAPGDPLQVFATDLGRIGVAICYDSEFPVLVRTLADSGADIILIPTCTERVSGYMRVRTAAAARALESTVATVLSPTIGDAPWSPAVDRNTGAAGIFVPPESGLSETGVLTEGTRDRPGWVTATLDRRALHRPRETGEMRNRADWMLQPGAGRLPAPAEIVDLTSP
jgi:predicted amidohydrolase